MLIAAVATIAPNAFADVHWTEGDVAYERLDDNTCQAWLQPQNFNASVVVPSSVEYNGITYTVQRLAGWVADYDPSMLYSLTVATPEIAEEACVNCTKLTTLELQDGVSEIGALAFANCTKLQYLDLPSTVTSIAEKAFMQTCISSVTIPAATAYIAPAAFAGNTSLTSITVEDGNQYYSADDQILYNLDQTQIVFAYDLNLGDGASFTIPSSVETILPCAFWWNSGITEMIIPANVKEICEGAFACMNRLEMFSLGENQDSFVVQNDGLYSTDGTILLAYPNAAKTVTFAPGIVSIGNYAMTGMNKISSLTVPEGVTSIGDYAFYLCKALESISLPSTLTTLGTHVMDQCSVLTSLELPAGVTAIPSYAFNMCDLLAEISLPEGLLEIGDCAFQSSGLVSVAIPAKTASVGPYAFYECTSLMTVTVDDAPVAFGEGAFQGCTRLQNVSLGKNAVSVGDFCFYGCPITIVDFCGSPCSVGEDSYILHAENTHGIVALGEYAFRGLLNETLDLSNVVSVGYRAIEECPNLKNVTFSDKLQHFGSFALDYCPNLESLDFGEGLVTLGEMSGFDTCPFDIIAPNIEECGSLYGSLVRRVVFGDKITQLPNFENSTLQSLTFGSGITEIPDRWAYSTMDNLVELNLGSGLLSIGELAFFRSNIEAIDLPASLIQLGWGAFSQSALRSASIHCSTLSEEAFSNCTSLTTVDFGNKLTTVPLNCFMGSAITEVTLPESCVSLDEQAFINCAALTKVSLHCTTLGEGAFQDCGSLQTVDFGENLTAVSRWAFSGTAIAEVILPESCTSIEENAFRDCSSLKKIVLPSGLQSISIFAFYTEDASKAPAISEIYCYGSTPASLSALAFNNYDATLYVPYGCIDIYASAPVWSYFQDIREFDANGIFDMINDTENMEGKIFDLQGRPVKSSDLAPGLYIINGKKVLLQQ